MNYLKLNIFLVALLSSRLMAQQDTLLQATPEKYDSLYKSFVKEKELEITNVWKLNLVDMNWARFSIGYEQKIGKSCSSESFLKAGLSSQPVMYDFFPEWEMSQRFKYYYNLNRRDKLGRKTNGFSANYLAVGIFAGESYFHRPGWNEKLFTDKFSYYGAGLYFGMQRRLGKSGFIEPYAGLLLKNQNSQAFVDEARLFTFNKPVHPWILSPEFGIRAGFYLDQPWMASPDMASKYQIKINLTDIGFIHANVGVEIKLAENLTSDIYLAGGLMQRPSIDSGRSSRFIFEGPSTFKMEVEAQIRYYLNFKRREAIGRNTTGFSGNYVAVSAYAGKHDYYYDFELNQSQTSSSWEMMHYSVGLRYGIQRRIGDVGFVDIFTGIGYDLQEFPDHLNFNGSIKLVKEMKGSFKPIIGIRAGISLGRFSDMRKITD